MTLNLFRLFFIVSTLLNPSCSLRLHLLPFLLLPLLLQVYKYERLFRVFLWTLFFVIILSFCVMTLANSRQLFQLIIDLREFTLHFSPFSHLFLTSMLLLLSRVSARKRKTLKCRFGIVIELLVILILCKFCKEFRFLFLFFYFFDGLRRNVRITFIQICIRLLVFSYDVCLRIYRIISLCCIIFCCSISSTLLLLFFISFFLRFILLSCVLIR